MGYADVARTYRDAGWVSPLPLPPGKKFPPPPGYTGAHAVDPTDEQVDAWIDQAHDNNVALRMPDTVVGIDVDSYPGKVGGETLRAAEERYGALPPTWRSTARSVDGLSGIYFFRLKNAIHLPGSLTIDGKSDVELVQRAHRYSVVWPSVHPEGTTYMWYRPDGVPSEGLVPDVDQLPYLPDAWVDGLLSQGGTLMGDGPRKAHASASEVEDFIAGFDDGEACEAVTSYMESAMAMLEDAESSRHDLANKATMRLVSMGTEGHKGVRPAIDAYGDMFVSLVSADRSDAVGEYRRLVHGAAEVKLAERGAVSDGMVEVVSDPCVVLEGEIVETATPDFEIPDDFTPEQVNLAVDQYNRERSRKLAARWVSQHERQHRKTGQLLDGGVILQDEVTIESIWGMGNDVLWAKGEPLMITGPTGIGKTTLGAQVIAGRMGVTGMENCLDLPVVPGKRVLYLAADRPRQIKRLLRRLLWDVPVEVLNSRLVIHEGPLPFDVAKEPEGLLKLCEEARADTVVLDSMKDLASKLSDEETGQGVNKAVQLCVTNHIEVMAYHHQVKNGANGGKANKISDVYGSNWLTAGMGSVIILYGDPGSPIATFTHAKQPASMVGPFNIHHDHASGLSQVHHSRDEAEVLRGSPGVPMSVRQIAMAVRGEDSEKSKDSTRSALNRLVKDEESNIHKTEVEGKVVYVFGDNIVLPDLEG